MSDVTANIHINVDSSSAVQNLKTLESQINQFQRSVGQSNSAAAASQQSLNKALVDGINNTGLFSAKMVPVTSSIESFTKALDNNKLSLGQYTRYATSQLPGMSRVFQSEFDTMEKVATDRVKKIQSRYVELGNSAKSVQQAIQITPNNLAQGYATDVAIAAQKQQMFNKLIDDGSTKLLNWGKNTQWAGRQLMVGFTLPLAAFGTLAAKTFMDLDKQARDFKRVYGDALTPPSEVAKNLDAVKGLASEYTKYGIAVKDTMQVASTAAAAGMQNDKLIDNTKESLRLATIGQIDYQQALNTTITLQNAFKTSNQDLAGSVDFIGAVANQTVLSVDDLTQAIPRVAPVIEGLGGNVKDLAVMLVAMKEGGVSAEQGANALKSGLASLINPTSSATESLNKYGIGLQEMIKANKGNIMGLVQDFGAALSKLDDFSRQQVLEKVFGKYQFARIGALFDNINEKTGQTANAMKLLGASSEELASMSKKSLDQISESTTAKFQASLENLKVSIAPIGEAFLKGITPVVNVISKIADAFNNLPEPIKNAVAVITGVVAGLGPIILMTVGLVANGFANIVKGIQLFRRVLGGIKGDSDQFNYLTTAELEAKTASDALEGSSRKLTQSLLLQKGAVAALVAEYQRYAGAAGLAANAGGIREGRPPLRRATGGTVPGSGNGDTVPALLTPGETVMNKKASQRYAPVISAMNAGTLQGFNEGLDLPGVQIPASLRVRGGAAPQSINNFYESIKHLDNAAETATKVLQQMAASGEVVNRKTFVAAMKAQGVVPELVEGRSAAHLTARNDSLTESGISFLTGAKGRGADGKSLVAQRILDSLEKMPDLQQFIKEYSGLTADLPAKLNRQLAVGTATVEDFSSAWSETGSRLLPSLKKFGNFSDKSSENMQALANFEEDLGRRVAERAIAENNGKVSDEILTQETKALIGEYKIAGGAMAEVATAAELAAKTVAQVSLDLSSAAGKAYIENNADKFHSVQTQDATNYYHTESGAFVRRESSSGNVRPGERTGDLAKQETQRVAREQGILEVESRREGIEQTVTEQDDLVHATRSPLRNSPHPQASIDGKDDAIAYKEEYESQLSQRQAEVDKTLEEASAKHVELSQQKAQMKRTPTKSSQAMELFGQGNTPLSLSQAVRDLSTEDEEMLALYTRMKKDKATDLQILTEMNDLEMQRKGVLEEEYDVQLRQTKTEVENAQTSKQTLVAEQEELRARQQKMIADEESAALQTENDLAANAGRVGGLKGFGKGIAGKAGMLGAGLGMASMIPFMAQDENGKFMGMDANTLGMGMMGGGMALEGVKMAAPMFAEGGIMASGGALAPFAAALSAAAVPLAAFAVVAAAGVIAFKIWRNNVDDAAKAAGDLGANLGGTANALNGINALLGKMTPAQRQTQLKLGMNDQQAQAAGQFQSAFESDAGKKFISDLKDATSEERFKKLNDYVKEGVASGALDKESATNFANAVAVQLNDAVTGNRVKAGISGMGVGSSAVLGYANDRANAVGSITQGMQGIFANNAINAAQIAALPRVVAGGGRYGAGYNPQIAAAQASLTPRQTIGSDEAAKVVGGSIQTVTEFSNALALANEELAKGTISATQYASISKQANDGIANYTKAMQDAIYASDDLGGTMSSLKDQLIQTGLSEEDATKITELKGNAEVSTAKVMSEAVSALSQGMDVKTISAITDYATNAKNKGTAAANAFTNQAYGGQAVALSGLAQNAQMGGIEGITGQKDIQQMVDVAFKFTQEGGNVGDYYNMIMSLPPEVRVDIDTKMSGLPSKEVKDYVDAINKINKSVGAKNLTDIMGSDQFKKSSTKEKTAIASSTEALSKNLGGNQEAIDKYINLVLKETPDGLTKDLPVINKNLEALNQIPPDMQKMLGINLSDPNMVAKIGPYADSLKTLGDVISGLPTDKQELAASLAYDVNGKPEDPAKFLSKFDKVESQMEKLKSKNISVKKKAMYEILTIQNGKPANQESLDAAEKSLEKKFGPGIVKKLPPDVYEKSMRLLYNAEELKKQAAALRKAAGLSSGEIAAELNKEASALEALAGTNTSEAYSSAAVGAGKTVGSDNGGGGGGGSNPFKDFKSSIANQIAKYIDAGASVKNLMSAKNNFMKLLSENKGIDDKVRAAKLTPALQEYVMGLDPKDANKVLSKITSKNGKLNKTGIALQDRYVAGQIKQTFSEAQTSSDTMTTQRSVAADLAKRGMLNKQTAEAIVGDPKKAATYAELLAKVKQGYKGAESTLQEYIKTINDSSQATENFAKELEALKDPAQFALDEISKQTDLIQANIKDQTETLTAASDAQFTALYGKTKDEADLIIRKNQVVIDQYQKQIDAIQEKNSLAQHEVELLDHSKKKYQDQIDAIQRIIDGYQRQIDLIQHEMDLRNHTSELINHQLDLMSRQEKNISDAYDKRIQALDQISSINQHLIDQQKQQIGLSQAFNQGDVFAAAQAANDMQNSSAQYASDQMRGSLEQGKQNAINGLTSENGMTRVQLEEQLQAISDQNFQSQQQIWDLNQKIYANQQDILPLKKSISDVDASIAVYNDQIWKNNQAIYDIQTNSIKPLQDQNKEWQSRLQLSSGNLEIAIKEATLNEAAQLRSLELATAHIEAIKKSQESTQGLRQEWELVGNQIADVNKLLSDRTKMVALNQKDIPLAVYKPDGKIDVNATLAALGQQYDKEIKDILAAAPQSLAQKKYAGGLVRGYALGGHIGMDSVPAMLTPGEFVMRKDSVDKYGAAMLSSMNMGAFELPKYKVSGTSQKVNGATSSARSINAPMYNTYSVNVNASTNASADDIANVVITKIRNIDNSSIRRINGY